jgi:quercetin dioxygenase-like cupin family protein
MPFDDRNIRWFPLGDLKHFVVSIYDVDHERQLVDFILKFEPNEQIILHRHTAQTSTLVIQGEHRIYEPDGSLKEVRAVGSYTASAPGAPHREGAGDSPSVVFYSIRGEKGGSMFELLNDDGTVAAVLGIDDFTAAYAEQKAAIANAAA